MRKRAAALILSVVMTLGAVLTGRGSGGPQANSGSEGRVSAPREADGSGSGKEVVSLRMIMYGDMTSRREEYFKKDFHEAVLNDLGIDLTVEFMPWGSDSTVATMLASGESFAVWNIVSAFDWAAKGYLAEIDEALIQEKLPNLIRVRTENNGFECVKHNNKIYAVPFGSKPYAGRMQTIEVRNDILKQVGYEASEITTYDQLMSAFEAVKQAFPDMRISRSSSYLWNALNSETSDQLVSIMSGTAFTYVDELENNDTVYSMYESEAYKNLCKLVRQWVENGYILQDEISNPTQGAADWEAGNCLTMYGTPGAWIDRSLQGAVPGAELALIKIGDNQKIKNLDYDWGFSISANDQKNVDRWLELFDWLYKDQDTYNFCIYGVEGKDWEYNEDGTIKKLVTDSFFDSWFMQAMEYNVYDKELSKEAIEAYETNDDGSLLSKTAGFSFNSEPVASELAMMTAVWTELIEPMTLGILDYDENYDKMIQQLKKAGLDKYMEEYQRQYSEWYAANRKQ